MPRNKQFFFISKDWFENNDNNRISYLWIVSLNRMLEQMQTINMRQKRIYIIIILLLKYYKFVYDWWLCKSIYLPRNLWVIVYFYYVNSNIIVLNFN